MIQAKHAQPAQSRRPSSLLVRSPSRWKVGAPVQTIEGIKESITAAKKALSSPVPEPVVRLSSSPDITSDMESWLPEFGSPEPSPVNPSATAMRIEYPSERFPASEPTTTALPSTLSSALSSLLSNVVSLMLREPWQILGCLLPRPRWARLSCHLPSSCVVAPYTRFHFPLVAAPHSDVRSFPSGCRCAVAAAASLPLQVPA